MTHTKIAPHALCFGTFALLSTLSVMSAEPRSQVLEFQEITPATSDAVLFNPGMGLYLAGGSGLSYKPPASAWTLSLSDIVYFRPSWNDLEAEGPGTGFDAYFDPIFDFWVRQRGKRVAFRVMSESMHSRWKYTTPEWVFKQGVPGVVHEGLRVDEQVDPVFWDQRYLDLHCQFIDRLGKYLDGRDGLEYVDIGGIGEWGEMHLGLHIRGRWTANQLEETGFTREKYVAAYRQVIDAHHRAFPTTRVFLNVGGYPEINDYAALRGCHFRQDGLSPSGPSNNVGKVYYHPYSRRGVMCNYEFHSGYHSMIEKGWDLPTTVTQGLSDPISYLNTNILSPRAWETAPDDVKQLFLGAAKKVGYRFVVSGARLPTQLHLRPMTPGRLIIEHSWKNVGVAPCYESYALEFTVHDGKQKVVARQVHFPRTPTSLWWPGQEVTERTLIRLPVGVKPGEFEVKVAMLLPERPERHILLGIEGRDAEDRYHLSTLPGVTSALTVDKVYQQTFEKAEHGWRGTQGIVADLDDTIAHEGKASLRLTGNEQGSWNYTSHSLKAPILPASKYRLSCWLKVDQLNPSHLAPYLKIGVNNSDGEWLDNFPTGRYDTQRMGTWQRLEGTVETPLDAATGHLALEKGGKNSAVAIRAWLDDVRLELLEAP